MIPKIESHKSDIDDQQFISISQGDNIVIVSREYLSTFLSDIKNKTQGHLK